MNIQLGVICVDMVNICRTGDSYSHSLSCSMVFWIGDLNYRLQTSSTMTSEKIRDYAEKYQIKTLQDIDQVLLNFATKLAKSYQNYCNISLFT